VRRVLSARDLKDQSGQKMVEGRCLRVLVQVKVPYKPIARWGVNHMPGEVLGCVWVAGLRIGGRRWHQVPSGLRLSLQ